MKHLVARIFELMTWSCDWAYARCLTSTCWLVELVGCLAWLLKCIGACIHWESDDQELLPEGVYLQEGFCYRNMETWNWSLSVTNFLCYEAEETWWNLGFDFSFAVSRSPNSGQSTRGTARKTRAYHGWNETDSNSNGSKVRKPLLLFVTNGIWRRKVLYRPCIERVDSFPNRMWYFIWIVRLTNRACDLLGTWTTVEWLRCSLRLGGLALNPGAPQLLTVYVTLGDLTAPCLSFRIYKIGLIIVHIS